MTSDKFQPLKRGGGKIIPQKVLFLLGSAKMQIEAPKAIEDHVVLTESALGGPEFEDSCVRLILWFS